VCLEVCLSSFDPQGELASLVDFDAWFDLPWVQEEYCLISLRNLEFWLLPS
jgi:hypothetical protein